MKKQIIIAGLFICLFFAKTIYASDCFVVYRFNSINVNHDDVDCFVKPKISKKEDSIIIPETNVFVVSSSNDNINLSFVKEAQNLINKLPKPMQSLLNDNGWQMIITEDNLAEKYFNGIYNSVMGATLYDKNIIYIEDRNNAISGSVLHECAHAIDKELQYMSNTNEFLEALNIDNYGMTLLCGNYTHWKESSAESFAESLSLYYEDKKQFSTYCPNMAVFFDEYLPK